MNKILFSLLFFFNANFVIFCQSDSLAIKDTSASSTINHIRIVYNKENDQIIFDRETKYWIFNEVGGIAKKGTGSSVLISNLEPRTYYLFFEYPPEKENGAIDFDNLPNPTYIIVLTREKNK